MTTATDRWLTLQAFSQQSGLSLATIRRRIRDGSIQVWQPGGPRTAIRIPLSALQPTSHSPSEAVSPSEPPIHRQQPRSVRRPRWQQAHL